MKRKHLKAIFIWLCRVLVVLLLTLLTQVGGLIYIVALLSCSYIAKKIKQSFLRGLTKLTFFIALYAVANNFIVPALAAKWGRVPLPIRSNPNLKPLTAFTYLCNRHYVAPDMKSTIMDAASFMAKQYEGTTTYYLEANFPFFNGYRLWPHLSHNDGKKLDIAFYYADKTGAIKQGSPSSIGYGVSEEPKVGETNQPKECKEKGYWQYNFMSKWVGQSKKDEYVFDTKRNKALLNYFAQNKTIEKIFIEPHLKQRMQLTNAKFRQHGCYAVRHDDHIHIQVK